MSKNAMPGVDSRDERVVFGANFRAARMQMRLRQRDIWQRTGIAQSHISGIEAGTANLALDTMVKLAKVVNVPLWRLFKPGEFKPVEADPRQMPRRTRARSSELLAEIGLDDDDLALLQETAEKRGMTVAEFVREMCREV